jgi:hypothetical protein
MIVSQEDARPPLHFLFAPPCGGLTPHSNLKERDGRPDVEVQHRSLVLIASDLLLRFLA